MRRHPVLCPRCHGPAGPTPGSTCPGCWPTCRAQFDRRKETAPCGQPADARELLYGVVRVCQRHWDLFMGAHLDEARDTLGRILGGR